MLIIKKLIVKEWFKFFFASFLVLFLLITVGTLISGLLRSSVTPVDVLMSYIIDLPTTFGRAFPAACLVASLFSVNKLKNRNELTAIFASGFSRKAYLVTIFQASMFIALFQFLVGGFVDPILKQNKNVLIPNNASKFTNLKSKGLKSKTIGSGYIWYKSSNYYLSFARFDQKKNSLKRVLMYYFDSNYKFMTKVKAKEVNYVDGKWVFINGVAHEKLNSKEFPIVRKFKSDQFYIEETPENFRQIEADITTLTFPYLYDYIEKLKDSGLNTNEYEVILLDKISSSLICIIFALISAIAIFNPNRRSSSFGKNIFFVFIFILIYWLVYSYCIELGKSSKINPILSCFSVPLFFTFYLGAFFIKNKHIK